MKQKMHLKTSVLALLIATAACGGSSSPAAPSATTTTTTTTVAPTWNQEGVRMTNITAGFPNTVLANPSVFRLNDNRFRMLVTGGTDPSGIISATSPDGLAWTFESGRRVQTSGDCGHVRAFRLDDGRVSVYCRNPSGILSYISSDEGLTLTREGTGLMITNAQVGAARLSTGGIVRTRDGRWRMYFSDGQRGLHAIRVFRRHARFGRNLGGDLERWPGVYERRVDHVAGL